MSGGDGKQAHLPAAELAAAVARLQAIRDRRGMSVPRMPRSNTSSGKRVPSPRFDPSLNAMLAQPSREMRLRALAMAQAGAAIRAAVSRDVADQIAPVSYFRGVLTIAAPDASVRFLLERQLRAGGERAILAMLRTPTTRIRVVVGHATEVIPSVPRTTPTVNETERDSQVEEST